MLLLQSISTAIILAILNAALVSAQNLSYGADNFYRSDNVTLWPITFSTLYQSDVAANLFAPNALDYNASHPAIVVGHPMGAVKEQAANLYAAKMAEQGFVTVSLDLPFWGMSEGSPDNSVLPDMYAEAFSAAVDFLGMQAYINRSAIGGIGICGSGGFLISAAKLDPRISAVATSSMYDMGELTRTGLNHSQSFTQRQQNIAEAARRRWTELEGAPTAYTGGAPLALTANSNAVEREFYDFYRTSRGKYTAPGRLPNTTTMPTAVSNTKFNNFYPFNDIDTISPRPILFVHGDRAFSRGFTQDAYERAAEPKELLWISNAGHTDLYDRVELIPFARLTQFFRTHLGGN
ncbi:alpha/beta-hydrolase [Hortaea werneckii]|nr:alpha/beta-hydrolase [Hortaea werneckii]